MERLGLAQWHVAARPRAKRWMLQVRDAYNGPVAAIYTDEADARMVAASPAMLRVLKLAVGSLAAFEARGLLTAPDAYVLRLARTLVAENLS
jgi:hypothetical protein